MEYTEIKKKARPLMVECTFRGNESVGVVDWLFFENMLFMPEKHDKIHVDGLEYIIDSVKKTYITNSEFTLLKVDCNVSFMRSCGAVEG